MQSLILFCFAALVASAHGKLHYQTPLTRYYVGGHPDVALYGHRRPHHRGRNARGSSWEHSAGKGKVFGTLGNTDDSLYGRGGYKQDIFHDYRGYLQGQAYGEKVLGPGGDSSVLGGKLNWNNANDNVRAGLELQKNIGGGSGMKLTGGGWKLDHNTRFVAGGNVQKYFSYHRPEELIQEPIEHGF